MPDAKPLDDDAAITLIWQCIQDATVVTQGCRQQGNGRARLAGEVGKRKADLGMI